MSTKTNTTPVDVTKITKGEAALGDENDACASVQLSNGNLIHFDRIDPMTGKRVCDRSEMLANVDLTIEAFNLANETGMGPREMKEQLDKAIAVIDMLVYLDTDKRYKALYPENRDVSHIVATLTKHP